MSSPLIGPDAWRMTWVNLNSWGLLWSAFKEFWPWVIGFIAYWIIVPYLIEAFVINGRHLVLDKKGKSQ